MKKPIIVTLLLSVHCLLFTTFAQVPAWQWANKAGGNVSDETASIDTDVSGNVYVCGKFYSPSIIFGSDTLTNADNTGNTADVFLVKYNSAGTVLWAKSAGGMMDDIANSVATDASGNVFICGYFQSTSILFGATTLNNTSTAFDLFLVKYDASGNVQWAKRAGGSGYEAANGVATDATGNAYITGYFTSAAFSMGSTTLSSGGSEEILVAKYDVSGNVMWANSAGGLYPDIASSVTIDATGNVYISGYYQSSSLVFGSTTLTHSGTNTTTDIFTVKYTSGGTVAWAKKAGGTASDIAYSVATDAGGNVFVAGYFDSPSIVFGSSTKTNAGGSDILLLKYSGIGTELTAIGAGGTGYEGAFSVTLDASGNIYLAGWFQLASLVIGSTTLTNAGGTDGFLIKYNAAMLPLWATGIGYDLNDQASAVALDASGYIYLSGYFQSYQMYLGTFLLHNTAPSGGSSDIFLGKLNSASVNMDEMIETRTNILSPTLFDDKLNIVMKNNEQYEIFLYDISARKIIQDKFTHSVTLYTEQFAKGVYIYEVRNKNGLCNKGKVVKD